MALSANRIIEHKGTLMLEKFPVVDGAITIYKGAILNYEASNIGYMMLGGDVASQEFAGIAYDYLAQAAGGSDGDNDLLVIPRGCGVWVKLPVTSTITIANVGDVVYADGDDKCDVVAGVVNNVALGTIRKFVDANTAWVQLDQ